MTPENPFDAIDPRGGLDLYRDDRPPTIVGVLTALLIAALLAIVVSLSGCIVADGPPVPGPGPRPTPVVTSSAWVVVVRESSTTSPAQARMLEAVVRAVQASGSKIRVYDPDDCVSGTALRVLDTLKLSKTVRETGLPCLIVLDSTGRVRLSSALPATEAETLAAIRKAVR